MDFLIKFSKKINILARIFVVVLSLSVDINFILNQVTKKVVEAYLLPAIELLGLMGNFVGHNVVS